MPRNRPVATLIAILALAAWPTAALAAGQAPSRLTLTVPSRLLHATTTTSATTPQQPTTTAQQPTTTVSALPRTGSDLGREGLIALVLIAGGVALRLGVYRRRA